MSKIVLLLYLFRYKNVIKIDLFAHRMSALCHCPLQCLYVCPLSALDISRVAILAILWAFIFKMNWELNHITNEKCDSYSLLAAIGYENFLEGVSRGWWVTPFSLIIYFPINYNVKFRNSQRGIKEIYIANRHTPQSIIPYPSVRCIPRKLSQS